MKSVDLDKLRIQFKGKQFSELVLYHIRRQNQTNRIKGILGTVALLPEAARDLVEGFIDRWNTRVYDQEFWRKDTADVFEEIIEDARNILRPLGLAENDKAAFNLFNIVVLNYAYNAYNQPGMREFIGINRYGK